MKTPSPDDRRALGSALLRALLEQPQLAKDIATVMQTQGVKPSTIVQYLSALQDVGVETGPLPKREVSEERKAQLAENLKKARAVKQAKRKEAAA
jgi:hypothetical protein